MKDGFFNPYVRYINKIAFRMHYTEKICAYDFRMFYTVKGTFTIAFEKEKTMLSEGDIVTIPPGTPYELIFPKGSEPEYYVVNFDFNYEAANQKARSPSPTHLFDRKDIFSVSCPDLFADIFVLRNAASLQPILEEISNEDIKQTIHSSYLKSALMKYLLTKMMALSSKPANTKIDTLISDIKNYINLNHKNHITNNSIAKEFLYHPYYLNSLFLKHEGITMHKYIDEVRLRNAKDVLISSDKTISEIAFDCGFSSASYFTEFFTANTGMSPKEYRRIPR